jgi:MFS family permease
VSRVLEAFVPARLGRDFRWLLASSWASNLGDGFSLAAGPLLVASQTRDARLVALATLLLQAPWLLFGLFAGALADRVNRRAIVVVADLLRAALIAVLALTIIAGVVDIAVVLVVLFLLGTAEVFAATASGVLLPMLVARDDLTLANSRLQTGFVTVNQLAGPPLGAALFATAMALPFLGETGLVVLGALLVSRVRLPAAAPAPVVRRRIRADIAAGFRWVVGNAAVRTLVLTILIFNITFGAAWSVLVLYAKQRLGLGAVGFSLLTTASALGGVVATTTYGAITRRVSLGNLMRIGLIVETLTHLSLAVTRTAWVAIAIFFVFGAHAFIWGTTSVTVRQRAVPIELQGRVQSVNALGTFGGMVLGSALGGPIAATWGITAPFWFAFAGSAVFVVAIWRQLRHVAHTDATPLPGAGPVETVLDVPPVPAANG